MGVYTIVVALQPSRARDATIPGNEFLMVLNARRGGWELPGGRAEPGEEPTACAEREFFEETGRRWRQPRLVQRRSGVLGEGYVYACRAGSQERAPPEDEITEARFFARLPPREALSFPDDPYEDLFAAVHRALSAPI